MAAKQKHIQRVKQRILEKLKSLDDQEQAHYAVLHEHISKVKQKATDLLQLEDGSQFLSQYSKVIQVLDACYNNLELITADAEDRLNSDTEDTLMVDTTVLETRSLAGDSCLTSPNFSLGYGDNLLCKDLGGDRRLPSEERTRVNNPAPVVVDDKTTPLSLNLQHSLINPTIDVATAAKQQSEGKSPSSAVSTPLVDSLKPVSIKVPQPEPVSGIKQPQISPKPLGVPVEVRKQLKQLEPVPESGSSNSSRVQSVEDLQTFEDNISSSTCSSPKKKSKKSKKKQSVSKTSKKNVTDSPDKTKPNKEQGIKDGKATATGAGISATVKETADSEAKSDKVTLRREVKTDKVTIDRELKSVKESEGRQVKASKVIVDSQAKAVSSSQDKTTGLGNNDISEYAKDKEKVTEKKETGDIDVSKDKITSEALQDIKQGGANGAAGRKSAKTSNEKTSKISVSDTSSAGDDAITLGERPRITQGTLLEIEVTPVVVSEVINPWCFYVQHCAIALTELQEAICTYMSNGGLSQKPLEEPRKGDLCLALFSVDKLYYRAIITKVYTEDSVATDVDVIFVDYGNREKVKAFKLRAVPDQLCSLPAQAICCALAEVSPCNKYNEWREEDILVFQQYVNHKQLQCMPVCRSSTSNMPYLVRLLMLTPVPMSNVTMCLNSISIASLLIGKGMAKEIAVPEQVTMILKSMEDMGDFVFSLGPSKSSGVEIKELSESHIEESVAHADLAVKDESLGLKTNEVETAAGAEVTETSRDDTLLSPRSECSDTESQHELIVKGVEKVDSNQTVRDIGGNLPGIKEEGEIDQGITDKVETLVSTSGSTELLETVSSATELDNTSDSKSVDTGFVSSDFNFNLDLNPQGHEVMLAHVVSPGLFYVHVISAQLGHTLDRLMKCLNQQFEKLNKRKLTRLSKSVKPELSKLYCAQFTKDNCFYRAMIKQLPNDNDKKMKDKVHVFYIDFGDEEWLPLSKVYPLPEPFIYLPPLVLKCSLAFVKPVGSESGNDWPEKATETFVSLATFEKRLLMHVVHGSLSADRKGQLVGEDDNSNISVLLIDNGTEEVCINMDLIRLGHAELDAKHPPTAKQENSEALQGWNPMEEDYFSVRNSYNIDVDDVGVATTGYKAQDETRICKFFNHGNCWRGDRCPWKHVKSVSGVTMDKDAVYAMDSNQESLLPDVHCWVAIEISTILTPSHFYAILPMGNKSLDGAETKKEKTAEYGEIQASETLDDLLAALNEEYNHKSAHEGTLILRAPGEIVVAQFQQDKQWYRARVLQATEEMVKVFYLDFGNTEWVSSREIHEIQPQFLHLPFQAIECFLQNVEPVGDRENWSTEAKTCFREHVDGKTLVGHVKSRSWNGCIWIELYDTTSEEDINIADTLVDKGFATRAATFTDTSSEVTSIRSDARSETIMVPG